jgi:benzoyl-CoA-dihydrodiol lyase
VVSFETHPSRYRHLKLQVEPPIARITLDIQENEGLLPHYQLKLNSYDMSVDIELADAVNRLRFEHPDVSVVIVSSAIAGTFCAGANIFMLGTSTHGFKVNFCKYTNETRLGIEDATENGGQTYIAALNGLASGGGYELALACDEIYLIDDRRSAVAFPEVPFLGVLPGTGGLTRLTDKRCVRRDRADVFSSLAEGIKGKRAVKWNLVDGVFPPSRFEEAINSRAQELVRKEHSGRSGITLGPLEVAISETGREYRHVSLKLGHVPRTAELVLRVPSDLPDLPSEAEQLGGDWYPLRAFRELDDALLHLRFNFPEVGLVLVRAMGDMADVRKLDAQLLEGRDHWFVNQVIHHMKRVLKRFDLTAKSFFALIDEGTCFCGSLFELALASDRAYMLDESGPEIGLTPMNAGPLPMSNGLTRIATRFLDHPEPALELAVEGRTLDPEQACEAGLVTEAYDEIDWEDEIRLAVEERASFSPDALTAMEANLRFAGPETLETKIFGRLSAWQNWIFQRPNAVGEHGALTLYGQPESPNFDWRRT